MNTQSSHNNLDNRSRDNQESRSLSGEEEKRLEEYFKAAQMEETSLFTKEQMSSLVRQADVRATGNVFRHLRRTIQYAPMLTMALAGTLCVAIGFCIAHMPNYFDYRIAQSQVSLPGTEMLRNIPTLTQPSPEASGTSAAKVYSRNQVDRSPTANKRYVKNDTISPQSAQTADTLFPVFAGLPPRATRLQSIHFLDLGAEQLSRLGVTISGKSTVEIARRLPLKDSTKPALIATWTVRAETLRYAVASSQHDEQKNAPILLSAESSQQRSTPAPNFRPYTLTDSLGRMLAVLPSAWSMPESAQHQWQLLFRGYDLRTKNDTAVTLLGIRLQHSSGLYAPELHNIVFWYRATPALIELLPGRLKEQMYSELRVGTLSQRLTHQRSKESYAEHSGEKSHSQQSLSPSAYYLAQTQTLVPNVLTLGSSIQHIKSDSPFRTSFSLYEARSLKVSLYTISGSLAQEIMTLPTAQGNQTVNLTLRNVPAGMYLLVFRTEYNETALQYLFVE